MTRHEQTLVYLPPRNESLTRPKIFVPWHITGAYVCSRHLKFYAVRRQKKPFGVSVAVLLLFQIFGKMETFRAINFFVKYMYILNVTGE